MENGINSCTSFIIRFKEALKDARKVAFITNIDDVVTFAWVRYSLFNIMGIVVRVWLMLYTKRW